MRSNRLLAASLALTLGINFVTLLTGLSPSGWQRTVQLLAIVALVVVMIFGSFITIGLKMADWDDPLDEEEFDRLVERSEELALSGTIEPPSEVDLLDPMSDDDFERIVAIALDELPEEVRAALSDNVAVLISDDGASHRAYGLYRGGTIARPVYADQVIIFRDTLRRDFGADPVMLVNQIVRVVRHEVAHHIGFDEPGVAKLGL